YLAHQRQVRPPHSYLHFTFPSALSAPVVSKSTNAAGAPTGNICTRNRFALARRFAAAAGSPLHSNNSRPSLDTDAVRRTTGSSSKRCSVLMRRNETCVGKLISGVLRPLRHATLNVPCPATAGSVATIAGQ